MIKQTAWPTTPTLTPTQPTKSARSANVWELTRNELFKL
jgi:hypothetical protein